MDILLDGQDHDLVVSGYDLVLVSGMDLIRQRIKQRILAVLGEWFLDTTIGLPWFQELAKKGISEQRVRSLLTLQIVQTEGVEKLIELSLDFDSQKRKLLVNFKARTIEGLISDGVNI